MVNGWYGQVQDPKQNGEVVATKRPADSKARVWDATETNN